jgi:hypothetical protein
MKQFVIFEHPVQGRVAVKTGFSWPAFFLGVCLSSLGCIVWFMANRLWRFAALWFIFFIVFMFLDNAIRTFIQDLSLQFTLLACLFAVFFLTSIAPAFKGNEWRSKNLPSIGYTRLSTVLAVSASAALKDVKSELRPSSGS